MTVTPICVIIILKIYMGALIHSEFHRKEVQKLITFLVAVACLILGYLFYSKIIEKNFAPDDRETPAIRLNDGVDYVVMPEWKLILIQLLNIAGTGPIFGALSGAVFGPVAYIWIVLGCIFCGAVHDFMCGMLSMRNDGASISEIVGKYLGNGMKQVMRIFSVILLVMCGVVFTVGPAGLLALLTPNVLSTTFWFVVIAIYYFIATFVPVDKIIGKIYPIFGIVLIIMVVGVSGSLLFSGNYEMPELWNHLTNMHPKGTSLWPFLCITIACGAISGFHATQSPLMARCCKSERQGRRVFYGAMIMEGIIALVWCAAGLSCYESTQALLEAGAGCSAVVYEICKSTMGKVGMVLALLGVIACPISSGDTAYRSARLTLADWFKLDQSSYKNRLILTIPLLVAGVVIAQFDYNIIWRYFSWSNQTLAMIVLWAASVYLAQEHKNVLFTAIPATFMTAVSLTYFTVAPECLGALWSAIGMTYQTYYLIGVIVGIICAVIALLLFARYYKKTKAIL